MTKNPNDISNLKLVKLHDETVKPPKTCQTVDKTLQY